MKVSICIQNVANFKKKVEITKIPSKYGIYFRLIRPKYVSKWTINRFKIDYRSGFYYVELQIHGFGTLNLYLVLVSTIFLFILVCGFKGDENFKSIQTCHACHFNTKIQWISPICRIWIAFPFWHWIVWNAHENRFQTNASQYHQHINDKRCNQILRFQTQNCVLSRAQSLYV